MTTSITPAAGAAAAPAATGALSAGAAEDRFLTLLVAQMRNQDPLSPMDNAQVTTQMAQISTVSGIDRLNATLKALAGGFAESQSLQAASLLGREVLVPGSTLNLAGGVAAGGFELAEDADQVAVTITDAAGLVVHRAMLGAQSAGVHAIGWDGMTDAGAPAPAGTYQFKVDAQRAGAAVGATTLAAARVAGVTRDASGAQLELAGLGRRPFSDVKQIFSGDQP